MALTINNLYISADAKEIVKGLDLTIEKGTVHAIMGPNGSGKSTLANTIMGHPKYMVTEGTIFVDGTDVTAEEPNKRAKAGLFLSMQYPPEVAGVTIVNFLRLATEARTGEKQNPMKFYAWLKEKMAALHIDPEFAGRYVHGGFSGGERKKMEILQLAVLQPTYAILDETDSGLDVDALRIVSEGINMFRSPEKGILLITHYNRILDYVQPDFVHIMIDGKIVKSGTAELAKEVEKTGYKNII